MADALSGLGADACSLDCERRNEARHWSCDRCELWFFDRQGRGHRIADVVTRNSSFCGLSVLARLPEPLRIGEPAEAVVPMPDKTRTHVAGTVAFCRDIDSHYYDIGIQVRAVRAQRILVADVESAKARYDWFAEALRIAE